MTGTKHDEHDKIPNLIMATSQCIHLNDIIETARVEMKVDIAYEEDSTNSTKKASRNDRIRNRNRYSEFD